MSATGGSPELLALIIQASHETVRIPLPKRGLATQLRQRLHGFRKNLRVIASRPLATPYDLANAAIAEQVETAIEVHESGECFLVVRPRDALFLQAIRDAGVNVDGQDTNMDALATELESPSSALDAYLKNKD